MQVMTWMTEKPYCVTADELLDSVASAMREGHFRHAPVVASDGRLLGMVSDRDLREQKGFLTSTKVTAVISEPAIALKPEDPIEDAAHIMLEHHIGALPVVDSERRVVGILTSDDLLRAFLDAEGTLGTVRIDLDVPTSRTKLPEAVLAVERAGAAVLSIGTIAARSGSGRRFYLRVPAANAASARSALQASGLVAARPA